MQKPIIEVKHIGKKYNITHQRGGYVALRDVLVNVLKAPFKFLRTKIRLAVGMEKKEDFWALKDVSFSVNKGEVIGIIGHNGAGKSTLLKILSQITPPTEGEIKIRGRIGSLLEVGTGFHPELTGRENIFLNGAILGMTKKEIVKKFEKIVSFAGIEKFLDTPVKYYSSGMYVRLAFSVAAHMEPEILIVDEVLAVGDAEFQKKCLGKMEEVTKSEGRTILFVSHNMGAIKQLCQKTILLEHGKIKKIGETAEVIELYKKDISDNSVTLKSGDEYAQIINCKVVNEKDESSVHFTTAEKIGIHIEYEVKGDLKIIPNYLISTTDGVEVFHNICQNPKYEKGLHSVTSWIPAHLLNSRYYKVKIALVSFGPTFDHAIQEMTFKVDDFVDAKERNGYSGEFHGVVRPHLDWEINS
ncbi:MAG: ABC transporter ATP-binding protein [bacterium]